MELIERTPRAPGTLLVGLALSLVPGAMHAQERGDPSSQPAPQVRLGIRWPRTVGEFDSLRTRAVVPALFRDFIPRGGGSQRRRYRSPLPT
jgi:hypothetical protein